MQWLWSVNEVFTRWPRGGYEAVEGCSGEGGSRDVYAKDICILPPSEGVDVNYVGNPCTSTFGSEQCEICSGDCDADRDCDGGLRCAQRSRSDGSENVPGCQWPDGSDNIRLENDDFCE